MFVLLIIKTIDMEDNYDFDAIMEECLQALEDGHVECPDYWEAKRQWDLGIVKKPIHLGMERYL